MGNGEKNINSSNEQQPKLHTYKNPTELILLLGLFAFIGIWLGIITIENSLLGAGILITCGVVCGYFIYFLSPRVIYNNETLQISSLFQKPETITWEEIIKIEGHPVFQAIRVFTKGRKIVTIPSQFGGMHKFINQLRWNRRDLFVAQDERVIQRNFSRWLLLAGMVAVGPFLFKISCAGWGLGAMLIIFGVVQLFRLPYKLILTNNGNAEIRFLLKNLEIPFCQFLPPIAIKDYIFQIATGKIFKIPLKYLLNNDALLFCYLKTWWEDQQTFLARPLGYNEFGPCECCSNTNLTVWGELEEKDVIAAVYYIHWTHTRPDHGATFDLVIGKWGEESSAADRFAVSLLFQIIEGVGQFIVIDANDRRIAESELVGTSFTREQVIDSPLKKRVFLMVDEIFLQDNRIAELRAS